MTDDDREKRLRQNGWTCRMCDRVITPSDEKHRTLEYIITRICSECLWSAGRPRGAS